MTHFGDRLLAAVDVKGNAVCVGLDPQFELLPQEIQAKALGKFGPSAKAVAEAFIAFNCAVIEAVADLVPACKPQIAFYEQFGAEGIRAFEETIRHARERGMIVISDAKRGDIGSTATAYARAHLGGTEIDGVRVSGFDADAVTVNPYLGLDTLRPFVEVAAGTGKGVFVLVKTSNPGSGDLQDLRAGRRVVFEHVAEMVRILGAARRGAFGLSDVGAVVAATHPEHARRLRLLLPEQWFLVPGYGAQGATATEAAACFRADGTGALVNSSRGIIFAYREEPYASRFSAGAFAAAAREAVRRMADDLNTAVARRPG